MATITTFAQFDATSSAANVKYVGSSGSFGTAANSGAFGAVAVSFSYLLDGFDDVAPISADFTLLATTAAPVQSAGSFRAEDQFTGSFSFVSTQAFTVYGMTYGVGTNLLSGNFSQAALYGTANGSTVGFSASTEAGSAIDFTSDVLRFGAVIDNDLALAGTATAPRLTVNASSLRFTDFKSIVTGGFSADDPVTRVAPPTDAVPVVPEPASWALMLGGFGLLGAAMRRRSAVVFA